MKKLLKYFSGLRLRIIIIISIFSMAIILLYSYFYARTANNLINKNSEKIANIIRNTLKGEAEIAITTGDTTFISSIMSEIVKDPAILSIEIFDSTGNKFIGISKDNFQAESIINLCSSACHREKIPVKKLETQNYFMFSFPIITLVDENEKFMGKMNVYFSKEPFIKILNRITFFSIVMGIIVLLFGFIFSLTLTRLFFERLKNIKTKLIEIAKGESDLTRRIEIKEDSEFQEIANSFNTFVNSLSKRIFTTKASSMRVSEFSENISSAIEELTASSHEVTDTVQKVANMATESAKNVLEASKSIKELLDIALTTSEEAKEMQEIENYSYNLALQGRKISENVSGELGRVTFAMNKLRNSIDNLGTLLKDILEISNTITIFMKRTNLLSLNASIEAARAGAHGKGFSIVANEIRRLAEDSSSYAEKIQGIVERITLTLEDSTKGLIDNQKAIENAKDTIIKAVEQLKKIADESEETMEKIEKIAKLTNMQRSEIEKLARFMDRVGEVTEQTSVSAEEIAASMEEQLASLEEISASTSELASISEELKASLRGFKID